FIVDDLRDDHLNAGNLECREPVPAGVGIRLTPCLAGQAERFTVEEDEAGHSARLPQASKHLVPDLIGVGLVGDVPDYAPRADYRIAPGRLFLVGHHDSTVFVRAGRAECRDGTLLIAEPIPEG